MLAAACLSLRLCAPRERVPLIATPPCIYARTTPFGQFFSCTSAQTQPGPTLTLTPTVCGAGARQGFSCVSVAFFHKKNSRPRGRPRLIRQRGVLHELFFIMVVLAVGDWGLSCFHVCPELQTCSRHACRSCFVQVLLLFGFPPTLSLRICIFPPSVPSLA